MTYFNCSKELFSRFEGLFNNINFNFYNSSLKIRQA